MSFKFIKNTLIATGIMLVQAITLPAEITEIRNIEDILPKIKKESFVLFNITGVLTDSTISLGSSQWRAYFRSQSL